MSAHSLLLTDLAYTAWANRRILDACSALTPEQLTRDLGASHHSVLQTCGHIFGSECFWSGCLIANALPPRNQIGGEDQPAPSFAELQQKWPAVSTALHQWLADLPEAAMASELGCDLGGGQRAHFSRAQIIRHLVNHSTAHRGQVTSMLRMLAPETHVTPPNTDLWSFYFSRFPSRA